MYVFGVADPSYPKDKLYAHLYTEGMGAKGGNNVTSCIFKTLQLMGILRDDEQGYELNLFMDNCGGQNKNRMVLRLPLYISERKYFRNTNIGFLEKGHTKIMPTKHTMN